jgi:[acyl-carrier-protein] S-malonyltransferase
VSFAFVFPGQGSQSLGMLGELAAGHPEVRATFEEASAALGYDLWQLVSSGPEEALNATERTQPAMLTAGVATWRVWRAEGGGLPAAVAGHSLGEFTALVCAEVLEFVPALTLVRFRGHVMQEAVPAGTGAMAAILGLDDEVLEGICREMSAGEVVEPVNFNSPGQVVIAGQAQAVQRVITVAKERGAKRALLLPVSVPAHSSLMRAAGLRLQERLQLTELRAPCIRFVSGVDAREHTDAGEIRELLGRQLASPVRWVATLRELAQGAQQIIECGPGKEFLALEDPQSVAAALTATRGESHA